MQCETTNCIEKSDCYQITNAATTGTPAPITDPVVSEGQSPNIYRIVTVINDTDQDVRIDFINTAQMAGKFIVPKSIKAFTKGLVSGQFINSSVKVTAIGGTATGKITFNFSS